MGDGKTVYVPGDTKYAPAPFAVYFPLGKSTLTDAQKNSIKYFVETSMATNKDRVFEIDGAADSATGSAKTNEKLGQARLDAVLNVIKPTDEEMGKTIEMMKKNIPESKKNPSYWENLLEQYYLYGYDMNLTDEIIDKFVTKENVQKMAKTVFKNSASL